MERKNEVRCPTSYSGTDITALLRRIGGEEFFLLLPAARVSQAAAVLDRLRAHLRDDGMFADVPDMRYTYSARITAFEAGHTADEVLRRADDALYEAKLPRLILLCPAFCEIIGPARTGHVENHCFAERNP